MNETQALPVTPLSQDRVAALTADENPRLQCDEPREQQSVPYQLHRYQSWVAQDYHAQREAERRARMRDTALSNCVILLQKEIKSLITRVRFLEENYRHLRDKYEKNAETPCNVNENKVLCDN